MRRAAADRLNYDFPHAMYNSIADRAVGAPYLLSLRQLLLVLAANGLVRPSRWLVMYHRVSSRTGS